MDWQDIAVYLIVGTTALLFFRNFWGKFFFRKKGGSCGTGGAGCGCGSKPSSQSETKTQRPEHH